jgi:hypothetical protein
MLGTISVEELDFLDENTFGELVTYPVISTLTNSPPTRQTRIRHRDGSHIIARLDSVRGSWMSIVRGSRQSSEESTLTLADVCLRVSAGVATGADAIFTVRTSELSPGLVNFAYPTISGRQLKDGVPLSVTDSLLLPYDEHGQLIDESKLGALRSYLREPSRRAKLLARTCVARKPWYAFHETPPLEDILRPKLLCKDIGADPFFVVDHDGSIVPRHTVYYIVPRKSAQLDALASYLNSEPAKQWLRNHCQRAANGFVRLQSHVIKRLPIPLSLASEAVDSEVRSGEGQALANAS